MGIDNCIDLIIIQVIHLDIYIDRNNLFNTNDQFDYGGFRTLVEAMTQTTSTATLFSYQFKDPGIYVFSLSTDANKKMVGTVNDSF